MKEIISSSKNEGNEDMEIGKKREERHEEQRSRKEIQPYSLKKTKNKKQTIVLIINIKTVQDFF